QSVCFAPVAVQEEVAQKETVVVSGLVHLGKIFDHRDRLLIKRSGRLLVPDRQPVHKERNDNDCHDQAKAHIELAANCFVNTHVPNLYVPLAFTARVPFRLLKNLLLILNCLPSPEPRPETLKKETSSLTGNERINKSKGMA